MTIIDVKCWTIFLIIVLYRCKNRNYYTSSAGIYGGALIYIYISAHVTHKKFSR